MVNQDFDFSSVIRIVTGELRGDDSDTLLVSRDEKVPLSAKASNRISLARITREKKEIQPLDTNDSYFDAEEITARMETISELIDGLVKDPRLVKHSLIGQCPYLDYCVKQCMHEAALKGLQRLEATSTCPCGKKWPVFLQTEYRSVKAT